MAEFFTTYAWVLWVALILIFAVVEVTTVDFTFAMLAVGSAGGLIAQLAGSPWWAQVVIAGVLALILIFLVRPTLHRALKRGGDPTPTNLEALLGLAGTVISPFVEGQGHVKLDNGETWTAKLSGLAAESTVATGQKIVVTGIVGATALIIPAERKTL